MIEGDEGAAAMPSSDELFASAVADTPVEKTPEPSAEEPKGPTRDEHGRFAAKQQEEAETPTAEAPAVEAAAPAEEPKPETAPAPVADRTPGPVPYDRFREVIEQNRQLMTLLQRQQQPHPTVTAQPAEPVDPVAALFEDPDTYLAKQVETRTSELQKQLEAQREEFSRFRAEQTHGRETVQAAYDALNIAIVEGRIDRDAALAALNKSADPFGEIVKWHEHALDQSDPTRVLKRQLAAMPESDRAAFLAQFGAGPAQQPSQQAPAPVVKLPPSLNRQTGASGNAASADMTSDAIFRHAVGK
jgi:hypothetical protein